MKTILSVSLVCITALFASAHARADVAPPDTQPCVSKAAGAACTYGTSGTCQEQTCSRSDYSKWDRDASSSPPSTTYACLKCITGTASNTITSTASVTGTTSTTQTATSTATTSPTATNTDTATTSPTATNTATATTSPTATNTITATTGPIDTTTTSAVGTATGSQTGTDTSPSSDSACSVGKGSAMGRVVPWLMAAAFSLLFLIGRRRK